MPALPNISSDLIQKYQEEISKNASVATAKRKSASLNKFFGWAQAEGHIDANPMPSPPPSPNGSYTTINPKSNKSIGLKTWAILGTTLGIIILIFLLTWKLKFPIQFINNMAANIGGGTVTQVVPTPTPASGISANPTGNTRWNLYANLKLTDATGAPQVGSQTITFKVYNTQNGGSPLYSEGPQTVTTDSNGSVLISLDQVPSDLFFQNRELFLEPEIGSVAASTRIPISTANIAANLGGYFPANPDTGAAELTIPVVDGNGSLNLASTSPAINAKAGTLLVQGQAVTVKSVDGGNGNIEINPDGSGIAHFLFEGSTGNFLNAQAPNLNSGSLYYGVVANNAAGYYLLKLQSGSTTPITRFSVDALGNASASGNINAGGDLQTAGVSRVSTAGALENITGYSQNSGNFTINQKPGDFASILKTGSALSNAVNITLDERTAPNASDYAALVLRRYNGNNDMALLVDVGNAQFNGQIRLGRFDTNPGAMGTGSLIYNATDNKVYVWDGSAWTAVGTSSISFDNITSGTNTSATMVVDTGASLDYANSGTINASSLEGSGKTWEAPGTIGSGTPNSGVFSSLSSTGTTTFGGITYTWPGIQPANGFLQTNGAGGLSWTTTVNATSVPFSGITTGTNLQAAMIVGSGSSLTYAGGVAADATINANQLLGGTWSAPGTIGLGTPNTGAFTTLTSSGNSTIGTGASTTNTIGSTTTPGALTLHGATTLNNTFTVSGNYLTTLGGNLAINGPTSADITSTTTTASVFNSTVTTLSLGGAATTINIGPTGSGAGSVVIAGGSADTGCTFNEATGDLTCSGNIIGSSSGTVGYWSRSGTTISPTTTNDIVSITSASGVPLTLTNTSAGNSFVVNDEAADTTPFVIDTSGNVGIGTTTPSYKLDIATAVANDRGVNIANTAATGTNYGVYSSVTGAATANYGLYTNVSGAGTNYAIYTNGTAPSTFGGAITTAGNLAVNGGTINSTGALTINSATGANDLTIDSGTTGAVNIGTNANSKIITIGNTATNTNIVLTKGASGNITLTGFDCSTLYTNGGKLSTDSSGNIICGNDVGGAGATNVPWSGLTSPSADLTLDHTAIGQYTTTMNWTATGALSPWTMNLINNDATAATQNFVTINNAVTAQAGNTEALLVLNNADTDTAIVDNALLITNSGGIASGITDAIDASASDIVNAINVGPNVILGTTANIDFTNFDVTGSTGDVNTAGVLQVGGTIEALRSFSVPQRLLISYANDINVPVLYIDSNGQITMNAQGAQAVRLNYDKGTGGVIFGTGAGGTAASIASNGNFTTIGDIYVNGGDINTASGNLTLQPAGAATIANVQIGVGGAGSTTPDFLGLDVKSDTGDPAGGFEGAMYYNTFDNKFRCYQGAAWADCIGTSGGPTTSTLQDVYNNDADGSDTIIALTTADDSLIFRNPAASGTDSTFLLKLDQLANAAVDGLQIAQAGTGAGLNMDFTNAGTTADGIIITSTNALTDAIDLSDADIVNAINVGSNVILGTAAVIDFTNFDVATTGHITVQPGYGLDTNAAGELKLGDTTATTVSVGGTAATTLSLGAGGSLIRTIDIGTGTGADTINVGTNAGSANTIAIGTGAVANAITIGTTTASSALALNDDNWNITGGGLANFVSVGAATPGTGAFTTLSATPTSNVTALTLTGTNVSSANLAYFNSNNTSGTIFNTAYGAGTILAGALIGSNLDLSTNLTATGYGITGQSITLPAVTNTGAGTYAYKGLAISSGGALIQNTGAGTDTWTGLDVAMPNITQTTGSVTSTGLKITGGTVTSGTSYALTTDSNAGNVGIGTTGPIAPLQIAGSPAGTTQYGMYLNTTLSGTTQNFGGRIAPTFNAVASSNNYGLDVRPQFAATSGGPQAVYYGVLGIPVITADASVNVTSAMAGYFRVDNLSTAGSVLGTAYGLYVAAPTATGTVSNTYALVTAAAAGNVGIGDLTPDHKLDVAGNIGLDAGGYINWGDTDGTSGYGFWDNGGTIEYKNSGGSWAAFGSGSSNWTLNTTDGTLYPINSTVDVLMGATSTASAKFAFTNMNTGTPVFQTTGVIHTGSIVTPTTLAYNQLGPTATTHTLTSSSDLLISGKGEINGVLYLNGRNISSSGGTSTIVFPSAPTAIDSYNLLTNGSWLIQNPASGGNPGIAALMVDQNKGGDILSASTSGVTKFTISNAGNVTIRPGTPGAGNGTMLTVGDGTGKIDAGTYDPVYNIDGTKYATYLSGMTGVKEETTGTLQTSEYIAGVGYRQVLDFKDLGVGSDLWLFSQATDVKNNIGQMVVLLSPTDNTRTWYQIDKNNYTLSVYSDRPTQVSYRLSAPRFDAATWGNYNDNPNSVGFEIHSSDLTGGSTQTPNGLSFADFEIVKNIESNAYKLYQNIADGGKIAIEEFGSFANLVAGNIKAGAVNVENIIAQNTQTTLISPIPGGTDVTVQIGSTATPSGKFAIQNSTGAEVASIDNTGNATFSGTVHSQNIDAIQKLLTQVSTDQSVLLSATAGANLNATGSATISELITNDLYVTGQAAINSLSVTKTITIGSDMIFGSEEKMVDGKLQIENTLNSLSTPLQIQSLAMAPIQIMAGLVTIDTHGNVQIAGDLVVAGKIRSSGLTIQDASGTQVAQVDATGSASFRDLAISGLAIASDSSASDSAVINGVIETNATAGKAIIPAGVSEITIKNPKVSDYTLIYITPTSSTLNNVLYVKSKETGQFVVGFTGPISQDVSFNWWIIETK